MFLGCVSRTLTPGCPAIVGCPLDMTSTYRNGTARAPQAIRDASESIETYSPFLDRDVSETVFSDLGDLPLTGTALEEALRLIFEAASRVLRAGARPLCLGGEHTITLPIVQALAEMHPDFVIIHLDAHSDLRDAYEGSTLNHATVMRRVAELVGPDRIIQLGIRSGDQGRILVDARPFHPPGLGTCSGERALEAHRGQADLSDPGPGRARSFMLSEHRKSRTRRMVLPGPRTAVTGSGTAPCPGSGRGRVEPRHRPLRSRSDHRGENRSRAGAHPRTRRCAILIICEVDRRRPP